MAVVCQTVEAQVAALLTNCAEDYCTPANLAHALETTRVRYDTRVKTVLTEREVVGV